MKMLLNIAMREAGTEEAEGSLNNERILQYAEEAGFDFYNSDETPWCSVFMNWVAREAGYERTNKANARSWLKTGKEVNQPEPGDVVVFWRGSIESWQGHVGIFVGYSQDLKRVYTLGGNQSDQVSISAYPTERVLGFRRLRILEKIDLGEEDISIGMRGQMVRRLQTALNTIGFSVGTVDGIFGPLTERGVKIFQSSEEDLDINGVAGEKTRGRIEDTLN